MPGYSWERTLIARLVALYTTEAALEGVSGTSERRDP
jgi:hypothetical protein